MNDKSNDVDDLLNELLDEPGEQVQQVGHQPAANEVPQWTAIETVQTPTFEADPLTQPASEPDQRNRNGLLLAVGVLALIALAGVGGWLIGRDDTSGGDSSQLASGVGGDDPAAAATGEEDGTETDAEDGTGEGAAEAEAPTDGAAQSSSDTDETTASTSGEPFVVPPTPDNPNGTPQYAVVKGGLFYFRGWYPSEEVAAAAMQGAADFLGPDVVIDESQIDPRAPIPGTTDYAVYLEDYILFPTDSAELAPDFYPLLDLGVAYLSANPNITEKVIARTDYRGSADYNLELSRRRAQAVADYYLAKGVNPDQIILDPRGEEGATQGVEEDVAMQDRRVEMILITTPPEG